MRTATILILFSIYTGMFFSCRQETAEPIPLFNEIESVMWNHPDSALSMLERMPKPSPDDRLNNATWCLLYTQAWDKNYRRHTSDSLVNIALRYFDKREDGLRKAQAWFYKGSVLYDLGKLEEATECYVRARDLTASFDDPLFASLICQTLGRIYREQGIYDKAFNLFREAINYTTQIPRSNDWSYAYSELGRTFAQRDQSDSARHYFELSLENAELIKDLKMQGMAINELGVTYQADGNYKKALEYGKKGLALKQLQGDKRNIPQIKYSLGSVYYYMNELDSAQKYFQESLSSSRIQTKRGAYKTLYAISSKQGKHKEAIDYIEQYLVYNDSINNMDLARVIAEAQEKYDNEKLENEKKSLMLEKERLQMSILCGGIVVALLVGSIAFAYQRKLWLKERSLRKSEEEIQEYLSNLHENEEKILQKQSLIQSLSKDLEEKGELEELVNDQVEQINILRGEMEYLRNQNDEYQSKIEEYVHAAKQNEEKIVKLEKLSTQNISYKKREIFLIDYINNHVSQFKALRMGSRQSIDWRLLYESLDLLYDGFYSRLKKAYPYLNEVDLQVCCLIKNGLTTSQIANILCISGTSVTKRKYRIRERMNQSQAKDEEFHTTLDIFLANY